FFRMRGTLPGLRLALRLAFDDCGDERMFDADDAASPASTRILEQCRARRTRAAVRGDPSEHRTIRTVPVAVGPWDPSQGGDRLVSAWRDALAAAGLIAGPGDPGTGFPVRAPAGAVGALWQAFVTQALGFV